MTIKKSVFDCDQKCYPQIYHRILIFHWLYMFPLKVTYMKEKLHNFLHMSSLISVTFSDGKVVIKI